MKTGVGYLSLHCVFQTYEEATQIDLTHARSVNHRAYFEWAGVAGTMLLQEKLRSEKYIQQDGLPSLRKPGSDRDVKVGVM